jgi:hypothetical protein
MHSIYRNGYNKSINSCLCLIGNLEENYFYLLNYYEKFVSVYPACAVNKVSLEKNCVVVPLL